MSASRGAPNSPPSGRWRLLALVVAAMLAVVLGRMMREREGRSRGRVAQPTPRLVGTPGEGGFREAGPVPPSPVTKTEALSPIARGIEEMLERLTRGGVSAAELAAFKASLLAADPRECIAAIRDFLVKGGNARTGQGFEIAAGGGAMAGTPTLRLLLLDVLGQQARKIHSNDAATVSRAILETKDSPDEWALALRNVAWAEPQSRGYVAGKVREMLGYAPWSAAPSDGMLEALDVAVWTRDPMLIQDLEAARATNPPLSHAVDIALDRLAETAPLEVLTYLNTNPATLAERPMLRADYFAKADLSNGAQRAQVELYLGRPDVALDEKTKLLRALVTPASFVSDTLLSGPPPADDGTARQAALAQATGDWIRTNRFPDLRTQIEDVQGRLAGKE